MFSAWNSKKQYIADRDDSVKIGIELPFRRALGSEGYFASTNDTISAVKTNIRNLLNTKVGERLMQPSMGLNLKKYLFEQLDDDLIIAIENDIYQTFKFWLPFVNIVDLQITMGGDNDIGRNQLNISLTFSINQDQNTFDTVNVTI